MITKEIMGEKILRRIAGGDVSSSIDVDIRDVYLEMETVYCYVVEKYLNLYGEDIQGEFITVYEDVPVIKNENRNRLYSQLPAQLISIRSTRNLSGLRQVSGMKDEYTAFIPMKSGDATVFYGLEASNLLGGVGYWLEGDKIIYENIPAYWEGKTVLVKMISSIYSLPEDAYVPIPAALELEMEDAIYSRIMGMKQTPEDNIADRTDNKK